MNKELTDMTLEELWELFPIILKPHNPEYFQWYKIEEDNISLALGECKIFRISHIGSSAVKGLLSKPTVDILLEMKEYYIEEAARVLENNGWIIMSSKNDPYISRSLNKGYTKNGYADKVYHLHIRPEGDWDDLYFRDYLIDNDKAAREYEILKLELCDKFKNDRDGYTEAKSDFVKKILKKARKQYSDLYNNY